MVTTDSISDAVRVLAHEHDLDPGLTCNYCDTSWTRLELRRFGDQACPTCGDLYPGFNREP